MITYEMLLCAIDEEIEELSAHMDALLERIRESQRGRGVPENELITRERVDDITRQVLGAR
jgi:hypothetical protein